MNNLLDFWTDEKEPIIETNQELPLEFQKCKQFGVPYMGSKNQIVKKLIEQLPSSKYFIDLFAGGCSMTHGAMLSGKYERFIANDISDAPSLFLDAINGKFKNETRWISRDDFFALKDKEPYIRYCWSFGNCARTYIYSKEIEPYKKAFWEFTVLKNPEPLKEFGFNVDELLDLPSTTERRLAFSKYLKKNKEFNDKSLQSFQLQNLQSLQSLERLERLQRLESLESLKSLKSLEVYQGYYKEVKLPEPSECVIYCDPPYKGTASYNGKNEITSFNHAELYDFCENLASKGYKIFISEYWMPPERFKSIFNVDKRQQLHGLGAGKVKQEHLFVPII